MRSSPAVPVTLITAIALIGLACVAATPAVSLAAAGEDDALLVRAQQRLAERDPSGALALLTDAQAQRSGEPTFDYLYGIAALDAGQPQRALLPLERVLAAQPAFAGARMEYARALYENGDTESAASQFRSLLQDDPPASTRTVIERYLATIERGRAVAPGRFTPLIEVGAGYDTNANGSTAESQFLGFDLNPENIETPSAFLEAGAGLGHTIALGTRSGLASFARLSHRANPDADYLDQTLLALSTQWLAKFGPTRLSAGLGGFAGMLDGAAHQRQASLDLGVARRFAGDWEASGLLRFSRVDFRQDALQIMEVDRSLVGLGLTRYNLGDRAGKLGVSLVAGRDTAAAGSPYGGDREGARVSGSVLLRPQSTLFAELSWQQTRFAGGNGFFGVARDDEQSVALLGLDVQNWPAVGWSLSPQIRFTQNDSNVALYEYSRTEASLFLRRSFR
jgi:outer membrane protein